MIWGSSLLSQLSPDCIVPLSPPLLTRSGTTHWKSAAFCESRLELRSLKFEMFLHSVEKSLK